MFENYPDVVSVTQLCEMLNIGKDKAYELLRNGTIKSIKVGKKFIIPKKSVIDFLSI